MWCACAPTSVSKIKKNCGNWKIYVLHISQQLETENPINCWYHWTENPRHQNLEVALVSEVTARTGYRLQLQKASKSSWVFEEMQLLRRKYTQKSKARWSNSFLAFLYEVLNFYEIFQLVVYVWLLSFKNLESHELNKLKMHFYIKFLLGTWPI